MFLRALGERGKSVHPSRLQGATARIAIVLALAGAVGGLAACGGGGERQDVDEPQADFPVEVATAEFPARQRLGQRSDLELAVENIGDEQIPDLGVTICVDACEADGPFSLRVGEAGLANPSRPVWVLEQDYPKLLKPSMTTADLDGAPTAGAEAVQTNTFNFGPMAPGGELDAVWRVTPVRGGTFTVNYEISAGLTGQARATTADGSPVEGSFVVTISTKPAKATVDEDGKVVIQGG